MNLTNSLRSSILASLHQKRIENKTEAAKAVVCGHLGDTPSRRQSSRRQTNSATRVGQLGDNLFPAFHIFLGL